MYQPKYRITSYLLNLIDESSYLRSWIDHAPLQLSWLPALQKEARTRNAHFSTAIEGNTLSLPQVKALERGEKINVRKNEELEVANYLKAMRWLEHHPTAPLNEKTLLFMHKLLTEGLLPDKKRGHYKLKQNYVINEKGFKVFTPPSPEETPRLVKELLEWLNLKETRILHPLLTSAIFHHRLVSIHPFSDGNGRLARALSTLILYQRDYDLHHIFSLDEFFANNRQRYYQKIQQARELDNELTHWIEFVAEGVVNTLKAVRQRIESLQVTSSYQLTLSPKQEEVLRILRDSPRVRGSEFTKQLQVSRARVNQLITPLIKGGLVSKEGQSRSTTYKLQIN